MISVKTRRRPAAALVLLALALGTAPAARAAEERWTVDPDHTTVEFKVRHMMVSWVKGHFPKLEGVVAFDPEDVTRTRVEATIPTEAVDTRHEKRDEHLRSADFFDVARFPAMAFKSKRVQNARPEGFELVGDLTIRGVTKEVVLAVEGPSPEITDPWGAVRRGATATAKINRKDFGLAWNKAIEAGGVAVGDEVYITLEIEAIKKKA